MVRQDFFLEEVAEVLGELLVAEYHLASGGVDVLPPADQVVPLILQHA